jgi:hypothetical protein
VPWSSCREHGRGGGCWSLRSYLGLTVEEWCMRGRRSGKGHKQRLYGAEEGMGSGATGSKGKQYQGSTRAVRPVSITDDQSGGP